MINTFVFDFFDVIRTDPSKSWMMQHKIKRTGKYSELFHKLDLGEIEQEDFLKSLSKFSNVAEKEIVQHYDNTDVVADSVIELIEKLKKNYKIGLLSNAPSKYLRGILNKHCHNDLFDVVVISSEVRLIKPSAEAFHHILNKLKSKPEETVFVDDNIDNVQAAEKLGIIGIHFENGQQLKVEKLTIII